MTYKLLLADDSVTIQRVIELTFAEEDVKVSTVGDGQAAIDRLESDPPDIVLADVDMPKRDGYEVAAYVKSRPKLAHIPVVLLTGAFEPIDQARADAAGSSDVLAKPFEPQMVINRVKQLLGKKDAEGPSPQSFAPPSPPPGKLSPGKPSPQAPQGAQGLKAPSAPRPPARSSMAMNDDHATQQNQPARPTPGQGGAQQPVSLDDYFDQLDAAFSNLQQPGSPAAQHDTMQAEEAWMDSQQPLDQQADTFEPLITPPPGLPRVNAEWGVDQPLAAAPPPAPPLMAPQPRPVPPPIGGARPAPAPTRPVPPAAPVPPPPSHAAPAAPSAYVPPVVPPSPIAPPPRPAAPVITDEMMEEIVQRVLQRLSDRVVRETVTDIVTGTAERLVQEEILKIKTEGQ